MTVIKINAITVPEGAGDELAKRFAARAGAVDNQEGFEGFELLRPTDIYVPEAMEILHNVPGVKALINITSDGLLNLARVEAKVGFEIDTLIEPHPIFELIQRYGNVPIWEMFEVFNMGIGFCYIVDPGAVASTLSILKRHGREAQVIGSALADAQRTVRIPQRGLEGRKKTFWPVDKSRRLAG